MKRSLVTLAAGAALSLSALAPTLTHASNPSMRHVVPSPLPIGRIDLTPIPAMVVAKVNPTVHLRSQRIALRSDDRLHHDSRDDRNRSRAGHDAHDDHGHHGANHR